MLLPSLPLASSNEIVTPPVLRMLRSRHKKAEKEPERFYLLPGMGGRAYRRKQKFILKSSLAVGLLISLLIAIVIYLLNRPL